MMKTRRLGLLFFLHLVFRCFFSFYSFFLIQAVIEHFPGSDVDIFGGKQVSQELYDRRVREALEDLPPPLFIDDGINNPDWMLEEGEEIWLG